MPVDIHSAHPTLSISDEAVRAAVERVAAGERLAILDLSVVLADHGVVRALNREWLGHDYETDVVSFALDPGSSPGQAPGSSPGQAPGSSPGQAPGSSPGQAPGSSPGQAFRREIDGEIYVDLDTAAERAPEFGVPMESEALRYIIHGLLHLAGHDDADEAGRGRMRELEDRYLGVG